MTRVEAELNIVIEAKFFTESVARFIIVPTPGSVVPFAYCTTDGMFEQATPPLTNGTTGVSIAVTRALAPGRPLRIRLRPDGAYAIAAVLHWKTDAPGDLPMVPVRDEASDFVGLGAGQGAGAASGPMAGWIVPQKR